MKKRKRTQQPEGEFTLTPAVRHLDLTVTYSVSECVARLSELARRPTPFWYGGKLDVDCIPVNPEVTEFHLVRHLGNSFEVEVHGYVQYVTETATWLHADIGIARATYQLLVLHALLILICVVIFPSAMPWFSNGHLSVFSPMIAIWLIVVVGSGIHCLFARNHLQHQIQDVLMH
jgi:hypothetical protein